MPHNVFISYKAEEFDEANWVKTVLEQNGISCWMAPMSIKGGSSYASEIPQAIRECKIFVLILSEKAQESKWVPKEIDQAINENKIILPFMLENCSLKDDFNFYLTNVQRYAAYESKSKAIEKMLIEIKAALGIDDIKIENINHNPSFLVNLDKIPVKKEKTKTSNKKFLKQKNNKKVLISILAVMLVIIIAPIMIFGLSNATNVIIGGENFKTNTSYVRFEDGGKKLTEEDIEKITQLSNVSSVDLDDCELPENAVCDLLKKDLSYLSLNNCGINDSDFENLEIPEKSVYGLQLNDNNITNLNVLIPIADHLKELHIDNNPISDISAVKNFQLNVLSMNNVGLTDVSLISEIASLKELYIDDNKVETLEPLRICEKIRLISVNNNNLSTLSGLEKSLELKEVYAQANNITSLQGLDNATVLLNVSLNDNLINDISILSKSKSTLTNLYINNNDISDISCLNGCVNLKLLYIDNNSITTLDSLAECVTLEKISAKNNNLTSATGLEKATNIVYADLSDNAIKDTNALKNIVKGGYSNLSLDLSNNQINELNVPVIEYSYLNLSGNKINDLSPIKKCKISKFIFDYSDEIDYASLSENEFYHIYVVDCPLDKQLEIKGIFGEFNTEFILADEVDDVESI